MCPLHLLTMPHSLIHHLQCPVCGSRHIAPALQATDYTVSRQVFAIWECADCTARFTQDVPDADSIGPFYAADSYISHTDTDTGLINKLYKLARRYTLRLKTRQIQRLSGRSAGHLLDVGAGTGAFAHAMQQAGWQVTGLEPDAGARSVAYKNYHLQLQSPDQLFQLPAHSFHVISLWHVLEHVHTLHDYFDQFQRLLAPGGVVLIAVPNYQSTDAAHYQQHWAAYDVPRHLYHFSPRSLSALAGLHDFAVVQRLPMWLDAFYIALLSEQYRHGRQRLIAAGWQGLRSVLGAVRSADAASSLLYVLLRHSS